MEIRNQITGYSNPVVHSNCQGLFAYIFCLFVETKKNGGTIVDSTTALVEIKTTHCSMTSVVRNKEIMELKHVIQPNNTEYY